MISYQEVTDGIFQEKDEICNHRPTDTHWHWYSCAEHNLVGAPISRWIGMSRSDICYRVRRLDVTNLEF